jgi:hypothetical protein
MPKGKGKKGEEGGRKPKIKMLPKPKPVTKQADPLRKVEIGGSSGS